MGTPETAQRWVRVAGYAGPGPDPSLSIAHPPLPRVLATLIHFRQRASLSLSLVAVAVARRVESTSERCSATYMEAGCQEYQPYLHLVSGRVFW